MRAEEFLNVSGLGSPLYEHSTFSSDAAFEKRLPSERIDVLVFNAGLHMIRNPLAIDQILGATPRN